MPYYRLQSHLLPIDVVMESLKCYMVQESASVAGARYITSSKGD